MTKLIIRWESSSGKEFAQEEFNFTGANTVYCSLSTLINSLIVARGENEAIP